MTAIEFSIIADADPDLEPIRRIVADFSQQHGVRVNITRMRWDEAWGTLLVNALHGKGPYVSHVGSTWGTTLGAMEALRPYGHEDLAQMGAPDAFIPLAWQSALRGGGQRVWAIPWTSFAYIICYRRDLIAEAGLDETNAFSTPQAVDESLVRLQERGVENPLVFPTTESYLDLVHITASWVWGAGGDLVDETGEKVLFASPEARRGLQAISISIGFYLRRFMAMVMTSASICSPVEKRQPSLLELMTPSLCGETKRLTRACASILVRRICQVPPGWVAITW
jgi:multiple sugar transport system substrate-binding protein